MCRNTSRKPAKTKKAGLLVISATGHERMIGSRPIG